MTSLAEFLLARIAEDEGQGRLRMLRAQQNYLTLQEPNLLGTVIPGWGEWPAIEALAARVLADVDAKNKIVTKARDYSPELEHGDNGEWAFEFVLWELAQPYSDHPDFDKRWRP